MSDREQRNTLSILNLLNVRKADHAMFLFKEIVYTEGRSNENNDNTDKQ
jgi:hypothetical protein